MDTSRLGAQLGPRLARIWLRSQLIAKAQSAPHDLRLTMQKIEDVSRLLRSELHPDVHDWLLTLADNDNLPTQFRGLYERAATSPGQLNTLAGILFGLFGAIPTAVQIGQILSQRAINQAYLENRNFPLPPDLAVQAFLDGFWDRDTAATEAGRSGWAPSRFEAAVQAMDREPTPGEVLEMVNRGIIEEGKARTYLRANGLLGDKIDELLRLRVRLHSPAELAEMVQRQELDEREGIREARRHGMTPERFEQLLGITGQPPGLGELLFMFRRGIIDTGRLRRGIRQSRYRNEWIPYIEELRFRPITGPTAANAVVQGFMSESDARRVWEQDGLDPEHFTPVLNMAGDPPAVGQMLELWNRGIWTKNQVVKGLRESRVKNKYIDDVLKLRVHLIPMRTITSAITNGVVGKKEGIAKLRDLGFTARDAEILVDLSTARKTSADRDLAKGEILFLFDTEAINRQKATELLTNLGYDDDEVGFLLAITELRRQRRFYEGAITRVHNLFVAHKIDGDEANGLLDALNVPPNQKANLLELWQLEAAANVRALTPAEILRAYRTGRRDRPWAAQRLGQVGYRVDDADLLLDMVTPAEAG